MKKRKKDQTKFERKILDKMKADIETLKSIFLCKHKNTWKKRPFSLSSEPLEIKLLKLMYHIESVRKRYVQDEDVEDDEEQISEEFIYDLAFGCSKMISKLSNMEVKHKTSQKMMTVQNLKNNVLNDLKKVYKRFLDDIEFDILHAAHNYSKFFIRTSYDSFLPGLEMSPYPSQLDTIQFISKNVSKNGFLLWLNTLTGEGKTSLVVAIAKLAMNFSASLNEDIKVIYCCSEKLKTIRHQVGQYAMKGAIPFCLMDYDKVNKKVNTISIKSVKNVLLIADIDSTLSLLEENKGEKYILFFDEPTFELDKKNSEMIGYLTRMFNVLPSMSILSTATAPLREDIPRLEKSFLQKYPKANIEFICSTRVQIGSEICGFDGKVFLPHVGCTTITELREVIDKIKKDGFLQKCYTANVVNAMYMTLLSIAKKYKLKTDGILNFGEEMQVSGNMNQLTIQKIGLSYLEKVLEISSLVLPQVASLPSERPLATTPSDEIVEKFCNIKFMKVPIDFRTMSERFSYFENQTLVVTENPKGFFNEYFQDYLSGAEKDMKMKFSDIYKKYTKEMEKFKEKEKEIYESVEKMSKMNKQEREILLQTRLNELFSQSPRMELSEKHIIGSKPYFEDRKEDTEGRVYISVDQIDWDEVVGEEKYLFGLALGVGIMSPSNMSHSYTQKVIDLASRGLLAYVIADEDICYGTNYPFENVIVDECLKDHSVKTIFQVFARAGRPGKSWKANIFAHQDILSIIKNYVFDPEYKDIETVHINMSLDRIDYIHPIDVKDFKDVKNFCDTFSSLDVKDDKDAAEDVEDVEDVNKTNKEDEIADSWEDM